MKARLACLLAILMLASSLASCAADTKPTEEATTPAVAETTAPAEVTTEIDTGRAATKDNLPDDLDFNGLLIHIHSFENEKFDIIGMEEESGDVVYDAVYHRTMSAADRLNVTIEWADSETTKWQDYSAELNRTIMAGDDEWQIVYAMGNATIQSNRGNLFVDLRDPKYIDYTQPWWWVGAMEEVSFNGKERKYLVGDIALSNYQRAGCVFFNKTLYQDAFGDPNELYKTVLDGNWTIDKMIELSSGAYNDVNGNGAVDEGDLYGLILGREEFLCHMEFATDVEHYHRNEEGYPVIEYDVDRAQLAVDKLYKLLFETTGNKFVKDSYTSNSLFSNRSTFFHVSQLIQAFSNDLREMEDDYGIIPNPKLDEAQTEYRNLLFNSSNFVTIPITCQHIDETCAVIEAMCAESYRSVIEPFYETAMKTKYSRDSYSGQCIDIIRDVTRKNLAYEYNGQFGSGFLIAVCVRDGSTNFSSLYASSVKTTNKIIEKTVEKLKKEQG